MKEYSERNFYNVTLILKKLISKKEKEYIEFMLSLVRLIENWAINGECKIDDRWFYLRNLISTSGNVIKEAFTKLLIKLLKLGKFEVISFYTYATKYLKNKNLRVNRSTRLYRHLIHSRLTI